MEMDESIKPRNVEPVSPMKIFAGLKLYGMKPAHAPMMAASRMAEL